MTKVGVEPFDDLVGDPVALVLGGDDFGPQLAGVGPGADHPVEEVRGADGVGARLGEEVEEGLVAGEEREPGHRSMLIPLGEVRRGDPFRRAAEPGFDDQLLELGAGDALEADQDGGVAVEVGGGEEDLRLAREQRLLGLLVGDPDGEDLAARRAALGLEAPELFDFALAQRPIPAKVFFRTFQSRLP